jgi:hypothetical protein
MLVLVLYINALAMVITNRSLSRQLIRVIVSIYISIINMPLVLSPLIPRLLLSSLAIVFTNRQLPYKSS